MAEYPPDEQAAFRLIRELHEMRYASNGEPDFSVVARDYLGSQEEARRLENIHRFYADHVRGAIGGTPSGRKADFEKLAQHATQAATKLRTLDRTLLFEACLAMLPEKQANGTLKAADFDDEDGDLLENMRGGQGVLFYGQVHKTTVFLDWLAEAADEVALSEQPHRGRPRRPEHLHDAFGQLAGMWRRVRLEEPTFSMNEGKTLEGKRFGSFVVAVLRSEKSTDKDVDRIAASLKDWFYEGGMTRL